MTPQTASPIHPLTAPAAVPAGAGITALREFFAFKLGAEEYGIDMLRVQEIRSYEPPTYLANAPAFVKGVINLRGVMVPIVDMRIRWCLDQLLSTLVPQKCRPSCQVTARPGQADSPNSLARSMQTMCGSHPLSRGPDAQRRGHAVFLSILSPLSGGFHEHT